MDRGRKVRTSLIVTTSALVLWILGSSAVISFLYGGRSVPAGILLSFASVIFVVSVLAFRSWIAGRVLSPGPRASRAVRAASYLAYPLVLFLVVATALPLSLDLEMYPRQDAVLVFRVTAAGEALLLLAWAVAFGLWHRLVSRTGGAGAVPRSAPR